MEMLARMFHQTADNMRKGIAPYRFSTMRPAVSKISIHHRETGRVAFVLSQVLRSVFLDTSSASLMRGAAI